MIHKQTVITFKGKVVFHKLLISSPGREIKGFFEEEACFMFVNKGTFSVRSAEYLIALKKGKALLAKCFDFFIETTKQEREDSDLEVIGVYLFPEIVEELFDIDISASSHRVNYNMKKIEVDGLLDNFRKGINVLLDNPILVDDDMVKTKLKEFILLINKTQNASQADFISSLFKINQTKFRTAISQNLYSNLTIAELSTLCGMSISSFKRKFSEIYGANPGKYISKMKLEKASKMLKSQKHRISDIAYDCGYETLSTFNRAFKSFYGQSPSHYRLNQNA